MSGGRVAGLLWVNKVAMRCHYGDHHRDSKPSGMQLHHHWSMILMAEPNPKLNFDGPRRLPGLSISLNPVILLKKKKESGCWHQTMEYGDDIVAYDVAASDIATASGDSNGSFACCLLCGSVNAPGIVVVYLYIV